MKNVRFFAHVVSLDPCSIGILDRQRSGHYGYYQVCLDPCSIGILDRHKKFGKNEKEYYCLDPCSIGILDRQNEEISIHYGRYVLIPAFLE